MLPRGLAHQGMGLFAIAPVGHTHRDHDPHDLVGQRPVQQPAGSTLTGLIECFTNRFGSSSLENSHLALDAV